jgi:hypothetical protein
MKSSASEIYSAVRDVRLSEPFSTKTVKVRAPAAQQRRMPIFQETSRRQPKRNDRIVRPRHARPVQAKIKMTHPSGDTQTLIPGQ